MVSNSSRKTLDLHLACLDGNYEWVCNALASGADVNSLDAKGSNALMCAIAGHHWNNLDISPEKHATNERFAIIRLLLEQPDINLATLNGPQDAFNGVTPLGMASWLNMADVVSLMLEASFGTVSVDAMDAHGATALMYAARDGNLDVVKTLFRHSARPDFRAQNHWSSVQYALLHHETLYYCEAVLRAHRLRDSKSPNTSRLSPHFVYSEEYIASSLKPLDAALLPVFTDETTSRTTNTLIKSITSNDLRSLRSLLFSPFIPSEPLPLLVNLPDSKGWCPIHYCVSTTEPSITTLDMLYCAGADVGLFTSSSDHWTPLHCLAAHARKSEDPESAVVLYQFITHLVQDLRAPLSARDSHAETCLHIAAEHGSCIEILVALLDCDILGNVRELRNERGLTAFEVSKPEFRIAFGALSSPTTPTPQHAIRASPSVLSLTSPSSLDLVPRSYNSAALELDVPKTIQTLLSHLRTTTPRNTPSSSSTSSADLDKTLHTAIQLSHTLLTFFRARIEEFTSDLHTLLEKSDNTKSLVEGIRPLVEEQLKERKLCPLDPPRRFLQRAGKRESEDSQITAVGSTASSSGFSSKTCVEPTPPPPSAKPKPSDAADSKSIRSLGRKRSGPLAQWFESLRSPQPSSPPKKDTKLKVWLKQKLLSERPDVKVVVEAPEEEEEEEDVKEPLPQQQQQQQCGIRIDEVALLGCETSYALRTSGYVFSIVCRDLNSVRSRAVAVEKMIKELSEWVSRVERTCEKAFKTRLSHIARLNANPDDDDTQQRQQKLTHHPSTNSLFTLSTSSLSLPETPPIVSQETEEDDRNLESLRRLLVKKIDPGCVVLTREVDRMRIWVGVVREVVYGVRRRGVL